MASSSADVEAKLEALLQAERGAMRVLVPLRTGKVTAKAAGGDMPLRSVSVAELTERMLREMVGIGHYFKRFTAMESTFGDSDHHLATLARAGGLI